MYTHKYTYIYEPIYIHTYTEICQYPTRNHLLHDNGKWLYKPMATLIGL